MALILVLSTIFTEFIGSLTITILEVQFSILTSKLLPLLEGAEM